MNAPEDADRRGGPELAESGSSADKPIVVGIDGSADSGAALRWAAAQAARSQHGIKLVTAFGPDHQFVDEEESRRLMDEVVTQAASDVQVAAPGVAISRSEHLGSPRRVLVEESEGASLLVVGSRGKGGFAGLLLGSVSRASIHGSKCPVVVVRSSDSDAASPVTSGSHRIVVGVDGSESSHAAVLWAARQAELTGATLEALMLWDWVQSYGWGFVTPRNLDPAAECGRLLEAALAPVRSAQPALTIDSAVVEGPASQLLVKASTGADLLVVGSRGHSELVGTLLGSVSEYCVIHAHCPVLVMRGPHG